MYYVPMVSKADLEQLRRRDPAALDAAFRKITPVLIRVLAANGIYKETAEDLIGQTWERFFTNLDKFEGRSELQTFVCGILINKIREHRKASGRALVEDDSEAALEKAFAGDGHWNDGGLDSTALVYAKELSLLIGECMEGLTEQQKTAFVLKEVDQDESEEICNVLGVSASHLRVLIFRAKEKLRLCLESKLAKTERF
jgi:RNA polymerase sigma-70 factor, ECF subfamily